MTQSRIDIDYTDVNYVCGKKLHQEFIKQEIQKFNDYFNELCDYDKRTGLLSIYLGLAWFCNSISSMSSLMIGSAFAISSHEFFGRTKYANHYQNQLNVLLELYRWCIKTGGEQQVTMDKCFLELTETIMPYVEYEDLKKPLANLKDVSDEFEKLFAKHPLYKHKFIKDKANATQGIFGFFGMNKKNDEILLQAEKEDKQSLSYSYNEFYSQTRFSLYGRETSESVSLIDKCKKIVEPLLPFRGMNAPS